jgi:glycerol-3-phosphate dehydrogenase
MAGVLGWDEEQVAREVEHYQPDDAFADAARLEAGEVVPTAS